MTNQYVNDFNTTVKTYYDELKKHKPITRTRERELIIKAKNGDINAQNEILTANLRFVFNVARRYKGNGAAISDLISEGNLGLIKAIDKFDPDRDVKFISYAVWWVRNAMQEFIKKRQMMLSIEKDEDALNAPVINNGFNFDHEDEYVTKAETMLSNEEDEEKRELSDNQRKIVNELLSSLTERERFIVEQYYGINGKEKNLEEIGNILGITKERVRQCKNVAFSKMRSNILLIDGADLFFK
jgi:RNA polymerase primary sigma factor